MATGNKEPPMPELRYFVSDEGVVGDLTERDPDIHKRRLSFVSVASSITLDFDDEEDSDDDSDLVVGVEDNVRPAPAYRRVPSIDKKPSLPLRRGSSNLTADSVPRLPGRRSSSAKRSTSQEKESRKHTLDVARLTIATAGV